MQVKQHYQQISLNHWWYSASENQNDVISLLFHIHFILRLQITTRRDVPFNTTFIFLFLQIYHLFLIQAVRLQAVNVCDWFHSLFSPFWFCNGQNYSGIRIFPRTCVFSLSV